MVLRTIHSRSREKHRPGRTCTINTTRGPSRHCPTATYPAPRSAPSSPVCTSLPLWSCWWATTSCCVRTALSAGRNTCTRAPQLVRAFVCWVRSNLSFKLQVQHWRAPIVYCCCPCRQKGWKNVHQCQEANADILTAPSHHFTSETLPSGEDITPIFPPCFPICYCVGLLTLSTPCCSADGCKAGMNFRKVNRHVDFPLILDMAPFCSALCKVLGYMCFKIHGKYTCLAIVGPNFHFVRTWQLASVSSTVCMGLWNTAAPCEWGTTLHTSKSALLRGEQNSTTRTCQVRLLLSSALFACSDCLWKLSVLQPRHHFIWDFLSVGMYNMFKLCVFSPKPACPVL